MRKDCERAAREYGKIFGMDKSEIKIYNSLTGNVQTEKVCGGAMLNWAYSTRPGRVLLETLLKRIFFSKICGFWASLGLSAAAARRFVRDNNIDESEFERPLDGFRTFNEFFTRELKASARPICVEDAALVFPADSRNKAFENVSAADFFYVKGQRMNLEKLLSSAELARRFEGGGMLISRLSPLDYHRFHYPLGGHIAARRSIGGFLYSVSPLALRRNLSYLWRNKRVLTMVEIREGAFMAMVEIGATNVGSIKLFDSVGDSAVKGAQKGYFQFGGSCVICLFEKGLVRFDDKLLSVTSEGMEYYAHVGQKAGEVLL